MSEYIDPLPGLTEGRIVHFVLGTGKNAGEHRPAIVVKVWNPKGDTIATRGLVQLQVFTDGVNDGSSYASGIHWATSVSFSEEPSPYTWHWPERA